MKVVIVNKSDATGGAAVVSYRLMEALRAEGVDARMLVAEKLTDSPYVALAAPKPLLKVPFLAERLKIFAANGGNMKTLFKIDTATDGVAVWRHPWIKEADAILLNWVNQGLLSLRGVERLASLGKPILWTMHDMWNFTGVCHHAGDCLRYRQSCGDCPLLGTKASADDISHRTLIRKLHAYGHGRIHFVAVSNWLAELARKSMLLKNQSISVIPNAFPLKSSERIHLVSPNAFSLKSSERIYVVNPRCDSNPMSASESDSNLTWGSTRSTDSNLGEVACAPTIQLLFGAARLDDPIKGFPILIEATRQLAERHPELAKQMRLVTFGNIRDASLLDQIAIPHEHRGMIRDKEEVRRLYEDSHIVVSTSLYETLPGTLVEGQAYGAIPVAFDRGGQGDIVTHLQTGFLARYSDDIRESASGIVEGILWASSQKGDILRRMRQNVQTRFSAPAVARSYISLIKSL